MIISACLLGENCRYDGTSSVSDKVKPFLKGTDPIPICPEVEAGLGVPRPRAWIENGTGADVLDGHARVINELGQDVTGLFMDGAAIVLKLVERNRIEVAALKSRSPSCGYGRIYRDSRLVDGNGVTAELLQRYGIKVISVD